MQEKQNNWQRIEAVIKWANMSTNYFARHIGLARGENLYQIKRGNNGISLDVADRIVTSFPEIDKLWLLTGEGQMFSATNKRGVQIPYYNVELVRGLSHLEHLESENYFIMPQLGACDFAMRYVGRDMGHGLPPGSVVFLRKIDPDAIIPGGEYVIVCQKIVTLRIVRAADQKGQLRLVPADRENHDDIIVNVSDIKSVYKVKGKLIVNS